MVEADFSGSFTNAENVKEGDIGIILDEGVYEAKTDMKGKPYKQLNIGVEINGKQLTHSPAIMEGRKLVMGLGRDTKAWIGQKFTCHIVRYAAVGGTKTKVEIEAIKEIKA